QIDEAWLLPGMVELHVDDEVLLPVSWCTNYVAREGFTEILRCVRLKSGAVFVAGVGDLQKWAARRNWLRCDLPLQC
ncbi:MAG: hypothetical protein WCJ17_04080, partial [bacterium]